jgi:hypothetical protein
VVEAVSNHVVQSHLHRFWDQHRDERLTRDDDSDQLLHASGCFRDIELLKVRNVLELTVDEFVGFLESTSYVSRYIETLGGLEQERYCADFRDELHAAHGSDRINVNFDIHMIMAEAV